MHSNILQALNWRYATKKFDITKKVSDIDLNTILEAARLAPSSSGLQPYKLIVVENPEIRHVLVDATFNKSQLTTASHIVILATLKSIEPAYIEEQLDLNAIAQNVAKDTLIGLRERFEKARDRHMHDVPAWAGKQAYIALGMMIETAALLGIDACPMEGMDAQKFDEILQLDSLGLQSQVMIAFGYRAVDDTAALRPKVRMPLETLIIKR